MVCSVSCMISLIFLVSMIYMNNAVSKNKVVDKYKNTLPVHLQELYDTLVIERTSIYYYGYALGVVLSVIIIYYNLKVKGVKLSTMGLVCITMSTSFITNYFYYILSPKTTYMLNHIDNGEQAKAWLIMYRSMQVYYHTGLVLGILAVALLAYAFRC